MTESSFLDINQNKYDFKDDLNYLDVFPKGLSKDVVIKLSKIKNEPEWMLNFRLKAFDHFLKMEMPIWGADLSKIDFNDITYYMSPNSKVANSWDDVPDNIKKTFDKLGIPESEKKFLAGAGAMIESTTAYHKLREDLEKKGVIFCDTDTAVQKYPDLVKKYFATVIPIVDNKFSALNSAVWSGGSFVYVPKNVKVDMPLQAYFRINAERMGQFERTLIIVDEGAEVSYIEGCLPAWEEVSCGDSLVSIPEIKEGNIVLNSNGENSVVEKTMKRHFDGELINIQPVSIGNTFSLTPEHPVLAINRERVITSKRKDGRLSDYKTKKLLNSKPEFIKAGELKNGDFLVFPINKVEEDNLEMNETKLKFLGYYLSKGHTGKINGCDAVVLSFNENERDYINEAKELCKEIIKKIPSEFNCKEKHELRLTVYSKELKELCDKHCGNYASMKKLSNEIMNLPPSKQRHLIETYINGDGNVYDKVRKDRKSKQVAVRSSTTSRQLAFQIQELLGRQGIYSMINTREAFDEKMKDERVIYHNKLYINYFGKDNLIKNVKRKGNYFLVPIRKIGRHNYKGNVYNFHVTGEPNTYLVKGFAVHNCSAPSYSTNSLHSAVVEVVALKDSRVRYTTLQNWSDNIYNLVTKRAHAFENAYVEWLDANMGCLIGSTKIFMKGDVKEIKNVDIGDIVYSLDENLKLVEKKVLAKKYSGKKEVFKIETSNRRQVYATTNHPFLVLKKGGKYSALCWQALEFIEEGDLVAVSGDVPDSGKSYLLPNLPKISRIKTKIKIPEKSNAELMWLLGFYIGDGYPDNARVCFSLTTEDKSYSKLVGSLESLFGITKYRQSANAVLRVNSKLLIEWILSLGLKGHAGQKRMPKWIFSLPKNEKLAFIRGYVDADGYIRDGHKNVSITSANKALLEDIKTLSLTCGLEAMKISKWSRKEKKPLGKIEKEYIHYFLYFGEKKLNDPIYFMPVISKDFYGLEDTWDLEIDGAPNFVADGFIVHNSHITMKYPSVYLRGEHAKANILSVAFANSGQHQDAGAKALHFAPNTSSTILSKSISKGSGKTTFRGLIHVSKGAKNSKAHMKCDALLINKESKSDTIPSLRINEDDVSIGHEATVGKVGEDQLFYLMSRGLSEEQATTLIVSGFFKQFTKELPLEYALEFTKLIEMEMKNDIS